jgi:hypothetical protein
MRTGVSKVEGGMQLKSRGNGSVFKVGRLEHNVAEAWHEAVPSIYSHGVASSAGMVALCHIPNDASQYVLGILSLRPPNDNCLCRTSGRDRGLSKTPAHYLSRVLLHVDCRYGNF